MITAGTRATTRNAARIQSLNKGQSPPGDMLNRWPPARPLLPPVPVLLRVGVSARCQTLLHTFVNLIAPNRFGSDAVIDLGGLPATSSRPLLRLNSATIGRIAGLYTKIQDIAPMWLFCNQ